MGVSIGARHSPGTALFTCLYTVSFGYTVSAGYTVSTAAAGRLSGPAKPAL
jgi:hypothetical protein